MPGIPLLHAFDKVQLDKAGLIQLPNKIPSTWEPDPTKYEPAAFPTPFGRAVATTLVLQEGQLGAPLFDQFRLLLLGVVSGVLEVVPEDLLGLDNLGRALHQVDADARYFSRIVMRNVGMTYGASYRSCLFWSHARRNSDDWTRLSQAIQPKLEIALALLSQWRDSITKAGKWNSELIPWQRGIEKVIERAGGINVGAASLEGDTAQAGPLRAVLPSGTGESKVDWLYVPRYDQGRLKRFRNVLVTRPQITPDGIALVDQAGVVRAQVFVPNPAAGASKLAAGMGAVTFLEGGAPLAAGKPQLDEYKRLLEPIQRALAEEQRATDDASIQTTPWAYPDALRLIELTRASIDESLILSNRAHQACLNGEELPPEGSEDKAEIAVGAKRLVLCDRIGGEQLLELRALGSTLFRFFTGEFAVRGGGLVPGPAAPTLAAGAALFASDSRNPLEPGVDIVKAVTGDPPLSLQKRLATLQRFVASYADAEPILARAARSFATWAADRDAPVQPLGSPSPRASTFVPTPGISLNLAVDTAPSRL